MRALLILAASLPLAAQTFQPIGTSGDGCIGGTVWTTPSLRYGPNFTCTVPAGPPGYYDVKLSFAEPTYATAGMRAFSVSLNGYLAVPRIDLIAAGGVKGQPYDLPISAPILSVDGMIKVTVAALPGSTNGLLSFISVIPRVPEKPPRYFCGTNMSCTWSVLLNAYMIDAGPEMMTKAALQAGQDTLCIDSGTVNALKCDTAWPYNGMNLGMVVRVIPANTNTGSATLALSGLSTLPIRRADGSVLVAGDLIKDRLTSVWFDGAAFRLLAAMATVQVCQGGTCAGIAKITTASGVYYGVPNPGVTISNCGNPPGASPCWLAPQ